ncbi:MAG: site-specific integrase [Pseudomonadota bacterium]
MATFRKLPSGKWQAQIARQGVRKSASFATRREAQDWAVRQEYLATSADPPRSTLTLKDVFDRYAREASPKKRGARWEIIRLEKLKREAIGGLRLSALGPAEFADWRDRRLREVAPASVNREMVLMSAVLTTARKEWGLIATNPLSDVRKPASPPARDRRVSGEEIERLIAAAGTDLAQATARAVHAFRFAIETAMRAGEIVGLTWEAIDRDTRVATLPRTKNGTARRVPLSIAALSLLDVLPDTGGSVFGLTSQQLDALFRKARDKARIEGLRFHDSRHEAITRLAAKLDVLSLARMVGHRDIRMLQVYYNETAEELARRLD